MSPNRHLPALLALLCLAALPASAATYVLGPDAALFDQADLVAEVDLVASLPAPGAAATDHLAQVRRVLGGGNPGPTVLIRRPGGTDPAGRALHLPGGPTLIDGERAIVFLEAHPDGTWGLLHWSLGLFHRREIDGRALARRDLDEATVLDLELGPGIDPARAYELFADWLADRGRGRLRPADYFLPAASDRFDSRYSLTRLERGPVRWFDFDAGGSVTWRIGDLSLGTAPQFIEAQSAWNDDPRSSIRYTVAGGTASRSGFLRADGVNAIIFNDPNGEVSGRFDCQTGGVLAAGGFWARGHNTTYRGRAFHRIIEGDIVVNDGMDCFLRGDPAAREELFGHELGHTLGLGHTNEKNALMWFALHDDGRGARLHPDDLAGARFLYGEGDERPPEPEGPSAPSDLTARAVSPTKIHLDWSDNSDDEDSFEIWVRPPDGEWKKLKNVASNATKTRYGKAQPGKVYTFTVRARRGRTYSDFSNRPQVETPTSGGGGGGGGGGGEALADPDDLDIAAVSPASVTLTWRDNSTAEETYEIWIKEPGAAWRLRDTATADTTRAVVPELEAKRTYRFKVRARQGELFSGFSNRVKVSLPDSSGLVAPTRLRARATGPGEVLLTWRDNSPNESKFEIWWRRGHRKWSLWGKTDRDVRVVVVGELKAGATYRFRVRGRRGAKRSEYTNTVRIEALAGPAR